MHVQVPTSFAKLIMIPPIAETLKKKNRIEAEALIREQTRVAYLGDSKALCSVLGGYKMLVDTRDLGFAPHMMFDGYWEYWLTRFMAMTIGPGSIVVDVGANLGYYTLLMAELVGPTGMVHAFEPNPAICGLLQSTINLNGFDSRVRVYNAAVVGKDGQREVTLFVPDADPKNATLVAEDFSRPSGKTVKVAAHWLDELNLGKVDFVKIDVEGAELAVLSGLVSIRDRFEPTIVCEVNFGRRYGYDDVLRHLGRNGQLSHIDYEGELRPLTMKMAEQERKHQDWLVCWPGSRISKVE